MATEITHIAIDDITTRPDVADLLGTSPAAVGVMVARGTDGIPQPFLTTRQGMLFSKREILNWAVRTGRVQPGATL